MSESAKPGTALDIAAWPQVDFAQFGTVEIKPLSRIQKLVSSYLARNWVMIPHVTQHDEADVAALDVHRRQYNEANGTKLSPLPYLVKAVVAALRAFPQFNASLDSAGNLVLKKYFHVGIAVDTPSGLLVPVIRDADKKNLAQIGAEIIEMGHQARTKGLSLSQMSGGCFTVSSLGSIGGTSFTPIINAPELAIMGISKTYQKACNVDGALVWRPMLPLSLSYDHRVINGADAARFCVYFAKALQSPAHLTD